MEFRNDPAETPRDHAQFFRYLVIAPKQLNWPIIHALTAFVALVAFVLLGEAVKNVMHREPGAKTHAPPRQPEASTSTHLKTKHH